MDAALDYSALEEKYVVLKKKYSSLKEDKTDLACDNFSMSLQILKLRSKRKPKMKKNKIDREFIQEVVDCVEKISKIEGVEFMDGVKDEWFKSAEAKREAVDQIAHNIEKKTDLERLDENKFNALKMQLIEAQNKSFNKWKKDN
jgi:hypothetical protein